MSHLSLNLVTPGYSWSTQRVVKRYFEIKQHKNWFSKLHRKYDSTQRSLFPISNHHTCFVNLTRFGTCQSSLIDYLPKTVYQACNTSYPCFLRNPCLFCVYHIHDEPSFCHLSESALYKKGTYIKKLQ